jgi:hypothetical protein
MATRKFYIERILRQIYGSQPTDDASITYNLVNSYLNDGVALAAKQCYKDNIQLEGIGFVNNSFYTTFKGIVVSKDENFIWKITLPQIPVGIGRNEGVSTLKFKDADGNVSLPCIPISENQATYFQGMRPIPNKILYKPEGKYLYALTTILLFRYTASVTLISGGDSTDLNSEFIVPDDYFPVISEYVKNQLAFERAAKQDLNNDGQDIP